MGVVVGKGGGKARVRVGVGWDRGDGGGVHG